MLVGFVWGCYQGSQFVDSEAHPCGRAGQQNAPRPTCMGRVKPFGRRVSSQGREKETRKKKFSSKWQIWGEGDILWVQWGANNWPGAHSGQTRQFTTLARSPWNLVRAVRSSQLPRRIVWADPTIHYLGQVAVESREGSEEPTIDQVRILAGPDRRPAQGENADFFVELHVQHLLSQCQGHNNLCNNCTKGSQRLLG